MNFVIHFSSRKVILYERFSARQADAVSTVLAQQHSQSWLMLVAQATKISWKKSDIFANNPFSVTNKQR